MEFKLTNKEIGTLRHSYYQAKSTPKINLSAQQLMDLHIKKAGKNPDAYEPVGDGEKLERSTVVVFTARLKSKAPAPPKAESAELVDELLSKAPAKPAPKPRAAKKKVSKKAPAKK